MSEQLAHPSLVEALCEVTFGPTTSWDWTIPGRLYDRLADRFPDKTSVPTMAFTTQIAQGTQPPIVVQANPDRVQFRRSDGSALVKVAPQLLAINHLVPYPGWDVFFNLIRSVLTEFTQTAPDALPATMGLRYINRIALHRGNLDEIRSVLTYAPPIGQNAAPRFSSFYQRYEFTIASPVGRLIHQTATQVAPDGQTSLVLDLNFQSTVETTNLLADADATQVWLDAAHTHIEEAFLESLTAEQLNTMRGA